MESLQLKTCTKCGESKPASEFYSHAATRDRLRTECKVCMKTARLAWRAANTDRDKDAALRNLYGIGLVQYKALLALQGGRCAGCGATKCKTGRALSVDHDRAHCPGRKGCSKCIRGLLCVADNFRDVLAGRPYIDWSSIVVTGGAA